MLNFQSSRQLAGLVELQLLVNFEAAACGSYNKRDKQLAALRKWRQTDVQSVIHHTFQIGFRLGQFRGLISPVRNKKDMTFSTNTALL